MGYRMLPKTIAVIILLLSSIPFSQINGQDGNSSRLPYGNRPSQSLVDEHSLRVRALHPYLAHMETASQIRQAREDFIYAYYELSFSYLRSMGDPVLHGPQVASRCAQRLQHLLRSYPVDPEASCFEASMLLDSLIFAESLPDADFQRVVKTIETVKVDGVAGLWIDALKAKIFDDKNVGELMDKFCQQVPKNGDKEFYMQKIRRAFRDDASPLSEIARRYKRLEAGSAIDGAGK